MRLYRWLLFLFPSSFRAEYGEEMTWVFSRRLRDTNGLSSRLLLWIEAVYEVLTNAILVHCDVLWQDLQFTARMLRRTPGFTFTAILVTALGVGATTGAFSIADHVLIRPLPFPDWQRLVKLWENAPGYSRVELSPLNYRDWKQMSTSFESMGAFTRSSVNLTGSGEPERLQGTSVTYDLLPILGIQPLLGRFFTPEEDREGAPGTLLISHSLWQTRFGGDHRVIGKKILLDDEPYVIIGVMPASFQYPGRDDKFWRTLRISQADFEDRDNDFLQALGKLKKGVTLEQARAEMAIIAAQLAKMYPNENAKAGSNLMLLRDEVPRQSRYLLFALVGASICVLLITSANLANLLLARAMARRKEFAVRAALGAGHQRLVRQLLTESLVLAAAGGALGILLAFALTPMLARIVPNALPIGEVPPPDMRVLFYSLLSTAVTAIGFGLIPALKIYHGTDASELHSGTRNAAGRRRERFRSALIVAEVTASVILLISSGLLLRAMLRIQMVDPGFQAENVLTLRTWLPWPKYEITAKRADFYRRVLTDVKALPGVSQASYVSFLPMVMRGGVSPITIPGRNWEPGDDHLASIRFVTPGFFNTLNIPLKNGRDVAEADMEKSQLVAVISESFSEKYWPGEDSLGRTFQFANRERTVVGVVGDIRVRGLEIESEPQVYLPYQQVPDRSMIFYPPKDLAIRFSGNAATLSSAVRQIVKKVDPNQPISDVRLLTDIVELETAPRGTQLRVIGAFALLAVVLASIGIHGLLSYAVSQRMQEFGVRMALGAQTREIFRLVMHEGIILATTGILIGIVLAYVFGRSMEALLAGVKPADPGTFAIAISVALLMTLAGSIIPAVRAVRTDPSAALRSE